MRDHIWKRELCSRVPREGGDPTLIDTGQSRPLPVRRGRLLARIRADRLFCARQAVAQHGDLPRQAVDLLPLGGDGAVEVLDHLVLVGDADFEGVEAGCVGHGCSYAGANSHATPRAMTLHCTWRDMMREAGQRLGAAGIEHPLRDVRLLMAQALGIEPVDVILRETDQIDPVALTAFEQLIQRRLAYEPVSRIRGWREFYGRRFIVTPDVLDPRPETELLVEQGLKRLPQGGRLLDLGTGSGCILASVLAERPDASGTGLDISPAALAVARRNAEALGVSNHVAFIEGSWDAINGGPFDLALSNPPYIPEADIAGLAQDVRGHDPRIALTPGGDGLGAYRAILDGVCAWLRPGGWIGFEFGMGQAPHVAALMRHAGLEDVSVHADLAGTDRAAFGRRRP